jgi:plastocyanin
VKTTRLLLAGVALAAVLAACGTASGDPGPGVPPADADVTITAKDMKFDSGSVTVPAGEPFTIFFRNQEGMPHNVAIYTDSSKSSKLFAGDLVSNTDVVYEVPALEPGTYFFDCELHPNMTGEMVAE